MLTILNSANHRQTDYSRDYLKREAQNVAKHAPESDGKVRSWSLVVHEGPERSGYATVVLRVDYLRVDGTATCLHVAL